MISRQIALTLLLVLPTTVFADLPSPQLHRIMPIGINAPGEVELNIVGADLEGVDALLFEHPGLKAAFVKDKVFKLTVAADVPAGTYDVRAVGRFGVTNPRLLSITHGLQDVTEVEPNNAAEKAQSITVNSAVDAQSDGNNQDLYRVALKQGQRVVIDVQSARLDAEMDATLVLFAASGQQLASNSDYYGRDPQIDFQAPADGDYLIEVRDLTYRGGYPYRLVVSHRPHIENIFPRAVQAGQTVELEVLGQNLGAGAQPSAWKLGDLPLEMLKLPVTGSTNILPTGAYRFLEHASQHSVLPTAATCTLVGEQIAPLNANPQILLLTDSPTAVEAEPNDTKEQAQPLTLPSILSARFDRERDVDWYTFETDDKGGAYGFDVYCERIAGRADPYLSVTDEKGNVAGSLDDFGHRIASFDGHLRDPSGTINLSPKTRYRVMVKDAYGRGGARYQYVLSVRKPQPDFFVASIQPGNNMSGTTIWQGGAEQLDIVVHAKDGFTDSIQVTAEGLPPGLHAAPLTISNNQRGTLVLWADDNAAPWTGPVKLFATAKVGEVTRRREVRAFCRVYNQVGSRETREHVFAVRERAPFKLWVEPEQITVEAGQKADVKLRLVRHWNDFKNAVDFQPLNFPGQFQLGNGKIAADQTEIAISMTVQAGTRPADYTLVIQGQAQVPFNKDSAKPDKPNTLVSAPSLPLTITVTEPPKKP
ncbi:MAG: PPC domain-containing protein [Planctomycetes bacterium]|nr:PPC domain-containing protein [Planctomycetota bacterium]